MNIVEFNVINYNPKSDKFERYNVIPYIIGSYNKLKEDNKPKTFEEFREYIKDIAMYRWWLRDEFEIMTEECPNQKPRNKLDVYWQVIMNLDLIVHIVMKIIKKS